MNEYYDPHRKKETNWKIISLILIMFITGFVLTFMVNNYIQEQKIAYYNQGRVDGANFIIMEQTDESVFFFIDYYDNATIKRRELASVCGVPE